MSKHVYECMFILDSNRYARDANSVAGKIPEMVQKCGGEVLASRLWNEQKLAYPIKGHRKGVYWLSYFQLESDKVTEFKRACQLNETILRNLMLKVEPRLVDALVAHARGERASSPPAGRAADSPAPKLETAKRDADASPDEQDVQE